MAGKIGGVIAVAALLGGLFWLAAPGEAAEGECGPVTLDQLFPYLDAHGHPIPTTTPTTTPEISATPNESETTSTGRLDDLQYERIDDHDHDRNDFNYHGGDDHNDNGRNNRNVANHRASATSARPDRTMHELGVRDAMAAGGREPGVFRIRRRP